MKHLRLARYLPLPTGEHESHGISVQIGWVVSPAPLGAVSWLADLRALLTL